MSSQKDICSHVVRNSRWLKSYSLGTINLTLKGYSRAAFRTGFYIPEWNIMLDAGCQNFKSPEYVFVTHCHVDHIFELPCTFLENRMDIYPKVYGPAGSKPYVQNFIKTFFEMNAQEPVKIKPEDAYLYTETRGGSIIDLDTNKNKLLVNVIECDHTVPTVSYIFNILRNKLKPEFKNKSGKEIGILRKNGVEITQPVEISQLSYICDCSISTLSQNEDIITKCPYVIIECTFLYDDDLDVASTKKHIHWKELEPYVRKHSEVEWILIHFSLRYKDSEVNEFFQKIDLPNVRPWLIGS